MNVCKICGNGTGNRVFNAREMMLGLGDPFDYFECDSCKCLQLLNPPGDWSRYYPREYYSFSSAPDRVIKRSFKRWRARHALGRFSVLGALLVRRWGAPPFTQWIGPAKVRCDDSILDVGSGAGQLLLDMKDAGFKRLTGIDPYIPHDLDFGGGVRVLRSPLREVEGLFDFVMMNHSFEHNGEPEAMLSEVARLIPKGSILLIRTPVSGKHAWREYGTAWVQLDAPRHLFLHTEESIRLLADRTDFKLQELRYDSTGFQFWGSEQYQQGISLYDERSYAVDAKSSIFTKGQIEAFERKAAELNKKKDGDQACFYLVRL